MRLRRLMRSLESLISWDRAWLRFNNIFISLIWFVIGQDESSRFVSINPFHAPRVNIGDLKHGWCVWVSGASLCPDNLTQPPTLVFKRWGMQCPWLHQNHIAWLETKKDSLMHNQRDSTRVLHLVLLPCQWPCLVKSARTDQASWKAHAARASDF